MAGHRQLHHLKPTIPQHGGQFKKAASWTAFRQRGWLSARVFSSPMPFYLGTSRVFKFFSFPEPSVSYLLGNRSTIGIVLPGDGTNSWWQIYLLWRYSDVYLLYHIIVALHERFSGFIYLPFPTIPRPNLSPGDHESLYWSHSFACPRNSGIEIRIYLYISRSLFRWLLSLINPHVGFSHVFL